MRYDLWHPAPLNPRPPWVGPRSRGAAGGLGGQSQGSRRRQTCFPCWKSWKQGRGLPRQPPPFACLGEPASDRCHRPGRWQGGYWWGDVGALLLLLLLLPGGRPSTMRRWGQVSCRRVLVPTLPCHLHHGPARVSPRPSAVGRAGSSARGRSELLSSPYGFIFLALWPRCRIRSFLRLGGNMSFDCLKAAVHSNYYWAEIPLLLLRRKARVKNRLLVLRGVVKDSSSLGSCSGWGWVTQRVQNRLAVASVGGTPGTDGRAAQTKPCGAGPCLLRAGDPRPVPGQAQHQRAGATGRALGSAGRTGFAPTRCCPGPRSGREQPWAPGAACPPGAAPLLHDRGLGGGRLPWRRLWALAAFTRALRGRAAVDQPVPVRAELPRSAAQSSPGLPRTSPRACALLTRSAQSLWTDAFLNKFIFP